MAEKKKNLSGNTDKQKLILGAIDDVLSALQVLNKSLQNAKITIVAHGILTPPDLAKNLRKAL